MFKYSPRYGYLRPSPLHESFALFKSSPSLLFSSSTRSPLLCGCHQSRHVRNLDIQSNQDIIDAKPFIAARKEYNLPPIQKYFKVFCPFLKRCPEPLEFGSELGRFRDVPAYSSYYESANPDKYYDEWCYMSYFNLVDHSMENGHRQKFVSPCCGSSGASNELTSQQQRSDAVDNSITTKRNHSLVYCGHFFQCVQGARFFLLKTYGLTFSDVKMAHQIFDMKSFHRVVTTPEEIVKEENTQKKNSDDSMMNTDSNAKGTSNSNTSKNNDNDENDDDDETFNLINSNLHIEDEHHPHHHHFQEVPVWTVGNGSSSSMLGNFSTSNLPKEDQELVKELQFDKRPVSGNVLIWVDSGFFKYTGHIGIVTEVVERPNDDERYPFGVRVWEQNFDDSSWDGKNYSRELPAFLDDQTGKLEIVEPIYGSIVKGWMATKCMLEHEKKLLSSEK